MSGSGSSETAAQAAAAEAAAAAFRESTIETWTLFAVGVTATILRTYARIRAVGVKGLRADDYTVWVGVIFYAAQSALGWNIGKLANGLANNGMTDEERKALSRDDPEYHMRVVGSQIQVAGWTCYSILIWAFKISMLCFFTRLTTGLGRPYKIRIRIGYALVIGTFVAAILAIYLPCIPIKKYWQIYPDPGNSCQAAISRPIVWTSFAANISTDLYLISIPLPMLWQSTLRTYKKIASSIVLGAGIFVLVCASIKSILVLVNPEEGAALAGAWGIREAFTAVMVTNLPMIFPLFKSWLKPLFPSFLRSTKRSQGYQGNKRSSPHSKGFRTIGGGTGRQHSRPTNTTDPTMETTLTWTDSDERPLDNVKMNHIGTTAGSTGGDDVDHGHSVADGILVQNRIEVTTQDRESPLDIEAQKPGQAW